MSPTLDLSKLNEIDRDRVTELYDHLTQRIKVKAGQLWVTVTAKEALDIKPTKYKVHKVAGNNVMIDTDAEGVCTVITLDELLREFVYEGDDTSHLPDEETALSAINRSRQANNMPPIPELPREFLAYCRAVIMETQ